LSLRPGCFQHKIDS